MLRLRGSGSAGRLALPSEIGCGPLGMEATPVFGVTSHSANISSAGSTHAISQCSGLTISERGKRDAEAGELSNSTW